MCEAHVVLVVVLLVGEGPGAVVKYGVRLERSDDLRLPVHGEACSQDTFVKWCRRQTAGGRRLAVDLFSGAGGLSLGLELAGWSVAVAVDNDPKSLQTHRHNFPGLAMDLDLGDEAQRTGLVALLQQVDVDLVAGGPPCQPFSRAGRSKIRSLVEAGMRDEHDHRRGLWRAFLELVIEIGPRAVLMENVPDMALGDDLRVVRTMTEELEAHGYHVRVRLADAWRHGVPQHRKRMILLARQDAEAFDWPDTLDVPTSVSDAIRDLPLLCGSTGGRRMAYGPSRPLSEFASRMRQDAEPDVVHDHMTRPVRPDDEAVFKLMDSGTLYSDIDKSLRRYRVDTFDDKYKRLGWNELSRSITAHIAKDGYWYIHPEEHRTLTVREAARIQTFPDRFRFAGTRSDAFRQIGNAVPPLLGEAAARALVPRQYRRLADPRPTHGRPQWRLVRDLLTRWADQQRGGENWPLLPGPDVTPAVAAVVALLMANRADLAAAAPVLEMLRGRSRLTSGELTQLQVLVMRDRPRAALERLRPLLPKRIVWKTPDTLADLSGMRPTEAELFRLLIGQDVLLASQPALRVAARIANTRSDERNRLSDGRLDLARVVGANQNAPLRMAALRLIGTKICRPAHPRCEACPLSQECPNSAVLPAEA